MAEPAAERPAGGVAAALSGIGATLMAVLHTRVELAVVEFEEVREQIKVMLALIVVATVFACFALIALSVLVVVSLWDRSPLAAIAGVAIVYALVSAGAVLGLRRQLQAHGQPFAATLSELERDAEALRRKQ